MIFAKRIVRPIAGLMALVAGFLFAFGCGGSSSPKQVVVTPPTNNAVALAAGGGPLGNYLNGVFTSVTVCVPGSTTSCQTIDNILVDTQSYGVRLLSTAGQGKFSLTLPKEKTTAGDPIGECISFLGGNFIWGPVATADVQIAGEKASSVPVHIIGDTSFAAAPTACSSQGSSSNDLNSLGANGFLGIGPFTEDCGAGCAPGGDATQNVYFACPSSGCVGGSSGFVSVAQQVSNPVSFFATDNNGTIIELPSVASAGAPSVTGTLVFGIGTQSNNALGSAKVLTLNDGSTNGFAADLFSVTFNGTEYVDGRSTGHQVFIDSGSNAFFFLDSNTTGLVLCGSSAPASDFYCTNKSGLSATNKGANGATSSVNFNVADFNTLSSNNNVFSNVAGPQPGDFDWGLSFFFGRNVFTAIAGKTAPGGTPPYMAY
jgi:hypothetical protein